MQHNDANTIIYKTPVDDMDFQFQNQFSKNILRNGAAAQQTDFLLPLGLDTNTKWICNCHEVFVLFSALPKQNWKKSVWIFNGSVSWSTENSFIFYCGLPSEVRACWNGKQTAKVFAQCRSVCSRNRACRHIGKRRKFDFVARLGISQFHEGNHVYSYFIFILQYWFYSQILYFSDSW